jgi:hypothetical protein
MGRYDAHRFCPRHIRWSLPRHTIWDVVVDPNYQKSRHWTQTRADINHPSASQSHGTHLSDDDQSTNLYKRIGFLENQTTTMVLHSQPLGYQPFLKLNLRCDVGQ